VTSCIHKTTFSKAKSLRKSVWSDYIIPIRFCIGHFEDLIPIMKATGIRIHRSNQVQASVYLPFDKCYLYGTCVNLKFYIRTLPVVSFKFK